MWFVYILKCYDNTSYVGCTTDVNRRVNEHNSKKVHYTKDKIPVKLVTFISFSDRYKALNLKSTLNPDPEGHFFIKDCFTKPFSICNTDAIGSKSEAITTRVSGTESVWSSQAS